MLASPTSETRGWQVVESREPMAQVKPKDILLKNYLYSRSMFFSC